MIYLHCYHLNRTAKDYSKSILLTNLSHYLGRTIDSGEIRKNVNGKPEIDGVSFSVSHSKNKLVQAFSAKGNLGVDIEYIDETRRVMALAKRYFHRFESQWLKTLDTGQSINEFYHLWSRKEAVCKAQGGRLWYYLQDNYLDKNQQMKDSIKGLTLTQLDETAHYSLVMAAENPDEDIKIIHE